MGKDTSYSSKEKFTKMMSKFSTSMPQTQRVTIFVKKTLLKLISHVYPHTLMMGDFNTSFSSVDISFRTNQAEKYWS